MGLLEFVGFVEMTSLLRRSDERLAMTERDVRSRKGKATRDAEEEHKARFIFAWPGRSRLIVSYLYLPAHRLNNLF